ncbi:MAG: hypothetical protein ACREHV_01360 [Rhizomicrobium sp.]
MRGFRLTAIAAIALLGSVLNSRADVIISTGATQDMSCVRGICAPTAPAAVLNASDLEAMLASGNVEVTTTGPGVQANNIRIDARFYAASANRLTLDASRSVAVDGPMKFAGAGGLSVITSDGGSGGEFWFGKNGHLTFKTLSSALTINGTGYTLVRSVAALANAIAANPSGAFALAMSYDASRDGTYATPPVATVFGGTFDGLGNAISNLTVNDQTENAYVGLFAEITTGATLANLSLANMNVTGGWGNSDVSSTEFVGGLVGYANGGTIAHVVGTGVVTAGQYSSVGGLAGIANGGIEFAETNISVSNGLLGNAGGIAGLANGPVTNSHATGTVSGSGFVGGLVGFIGITSIEHSSATGEVSGVDQYTYAGGLAGINEGTIAKSSATGVVNCELTCGGLVGMNGGSPGGGSAISQSYAMGDVSASEGVGGGLVGFSQLGTLSESYATGTVSGEIVGGLVGTNTNADGYHSVSRCYSAGAVSGGSAVGGLIGADELTSTIKRAYWDTTTSGITNKGQGAGNVANDAGIKGLSNTKLQSGLPKGFDAKIWREGSGINGGLPYLIANPPAK